MVKKLQKISAEKKSPPHLSGAVKESAQQIWLAGLGAFSKAQEGGGKVFEALMKEGLAIQRKTQAAAEEKISGATNKMAHMAGDIQSKAGHQWDKLESIFEDRVAKALNKLGVPSAKDIDALIARIDELNKTVQKMNGTAPTAKTPAASKTTRAHRSATAENVAATTNDVHAGVDTDTSTGTEAKTTLQTTLETAPKTVAPKTSRTKPAASKPVRAKRPATAVAPTPAVE